VCGSNFAGLTLVYIVLPCVAAVVPRPVRQCCTVIARFDVNRTKQRLLLLLFCISVKESIHETECVITVILLTSALTATVHFNCQYEATRSRGHQQFHDKHVFILHCCYLHSKYFNDHKLVHKVRALQTKYFYNTLNILTDWSSWGVTSHSTQNGWFRRRSSQPISWLSTKETKPNTTKKNTRTKWPPKLTWTNTQKTKHIQNTKKYKFNMQKCVCAYYCAQLSYTTQHSTEQFWLSSIEAPEFRCCLLEGRGQCYSVFINTFSRKIFHGTNGQTYYRMG